jgi:Ca2+-binding RTX toxin-like protein
LSIILLRRVAVVLGLCLPLIAGTVGTAHAEWAVVTDCFGTPLPAGPGQTSVIYAVAGNFTNGTNGDDVIIGSDGPDIINGLGGNDTICGGGGNDQIYGGFWDYEEGPDRDQIDGENGTDTIHGYNDDDVLRGGAMRDYLYGDDDTDAIYGGPGDDYIDCGPGNNDSADGGTHVVGGAADVDELAPNHSCYTVTNVP